VASNYEVNIKLNTRTVNKQLNNLEKRISKLNKLAQGGRASKTVNLQEKEKLKVASKKFQIETKSTRELKKQTLEKRKQQKIDQDNLRTINQQSTGRSTGMATGGSRGAGGKGGGVLSGALISGSFPLLFGQGPLGAAAGFGGGLIGGALGGQTGGFAGGLVATALLQTVTNTVNGINELGAALNDPTQNLDKLVTNLSRFDRNITASVQILQSAGLTASAGQFARARFGTEFGAGGANSLEEMNKAFKEFGKVSSKLGTELAILASGPLTGFMKMLNFVLGGGGKSEEGESLADTINRTINERENAIKKITDLETSLQENLKRRNELRAKFDTKEEQRELSASGELLKVQSAFRTVGQTIQTDQLSLKTLKESVKNFDAVVKLAELQQKILKETEVALKGQIELEEARFEGSEKELIVIEQRNKLKKLEFAIEKQIAEVKAVKESGSDLDLERAKQTLKNLKLQLDLEEQITLNRLNAADPAISRMNELNKKMRDLNDTTLQAVILSKAMGASFEDSFKGIIKGTMTVADAFRNMLNKIADYFLDAAAQMVATQFQKGILGLFSNLFNFSTTPLNDIQGTVGLAANGGPVGMRKPYIVGERGPELFVPNQSGNIIPNHDLAGVGGGGTNIVVNVDASGTNVEGDEDEGRALGIALSSAIETELIKQKRPGGLLA